jgi:ethanolamine utilization protein EutA
MKCVGQPAGGDRSRRVILMRMPTQPHTLADHRLGALFDHTHEGEDGHDHDHDEDPRHEIIDAASRDLEGASFLSIGVDVGSATTHVAFSRLMMRGAGEPASLRRLLKSKETLWISPIACTPWRDGEIDAEGIRTIVDAAFEAAHLHPDDIDTGAVILTGDAAASPGVKRKLLDLLAEDIGDLVSAAAGHRMEAMLAAWGSGAVETSLETGEDIVLIDIGGGTSKFASIRGGRVMGVGALCVGARHATFDSDGRVVRLTPEARDFARRTGSTWSQGAHATPEEVERVGATMADLILKALNDPRADDMIDLWATEPFEPISGTERLMLSGGVSEYVFGRETRDFGDLGPALGRSLRALLDSGAAPRVSTSPGEGIRATVLGASEHSLQISGETSFVSAPARLLPRRSLPVAAPNFSFIGDFDAGALAAAIAEKRRMLDLDGLEPDFALALRWRGDPDHARLAACARGVVAGLADRIAAEKPLFLLLEGDCALVLAGILRDELDLSVDLLALDGIVLRDLDWVDIGRLRLPSNTVPVTVKSLVFQDPPSSRLSRSSSRSVQT